MNNTMKIFMGCIGFLLLLLVLTKADDKKLRANLEYKLKPIYASLELDKTKNSRSIASETNTLESTLKALTYKGHLFFSVLKNKNKNAVSTNFLGMTFSPLLHGVKNNKVDLANFKLDLSKMNNHIHFLTAMKL